MGTISRLKPDAARHAPETQFNDPWQLAAEVGLTRGQKLAALRRWLATQGQSVPDRRWRQWLGLMRTAAATEGRAQLDAIDLWTAPYVVSPAPEWASRIEAWFEQDLLQSTPTQAPWLTRAVEAFEQQLRIEQSATPEGDDDGGAGKLALMRSVGGSSADIDAMLRIVAPGLERARQRRYSRTHVAARVAQLGEMLSQLAGERERIAAEQARLAATLPPRLWLPPTLAERLLAGRSQTLEHIDALLSRLQQTQAGFAALPLDEQLAETAPPPVEWAVPAP